MLVTTWAADCRLTSLLPYTPYGPPTPPAGVYCATTLAVRLACPVVACAHTRYAPGTPLAEAATFSIQTAYCPCAPPLTKAALLLVHSGCAASTVGVAHPDAPFGTGVCASIAGVTPTWRRYVTPSAIPALAKSLATPAAWAAPADFVDRLASTATDVPITAITVMTMTAMSIAAPASRSGRASLRVDEGRCAKRVMSGFCS